VHLGNIFSLPLGNSGIGINRDLSDVRRRAYREMKDHIHLAGVGSRMFLGCDGRPVIPILGEGLKNILLRPLKFVSGIDLTELEFGGTDDLVRAGAAGLAGHADSPDEKIGHRDEGDRHLIAGQIVGFDLNVGEQSGVVESDDAVANVIPVKRLALLLGDQIQQVRSFALGKLGKTNLADDTPCVTSNRA